LFAYKFVTFNDRTFSVGNLSSTFNSFLTFFSLYKYLSPEQLVTIKLRNKGPRS